MSLSSFSTEAILAAVTGEPRNKKFNRGLYGLEEDLVEEYVTPDPPVNTSTEFPAGAEKTDAVGADGSGVDSALANAGQDGAPATDLKDGTEDDEVAVDGGVTVSEPADNGEVEVEATLGSDVSDTLKAKIDDGNTPEEEVEQTEPELVEATTQAEGTVEAMHLAIQLQDRFVWSKEEDAPEGEKKAWYKRAWDAIAAFFVKVGQFISLMVKRLFAFITGKAMKQAATELMEKINAGKTIALDRKLTVNVYDKDVYDSVKDLVKDLEGLRYKVANGVVNFTKIVEKHASIPYGEGSKEFTTTVEENDGTADPNSAKNRKASSETIDGKAWEGLISGTGWTILSVLKALKDGKPFSKTLLPQLNKSLKTMMDNAKAVKKTAAANAKIENNEKSGAALKLATKELKAVQKITHELSSSISRTAQIALNIETVSVKFARAGLKEIKAE